MAKRKATRSMREAGRANITKYHEEHPEGNQLKHGAYSGTIRKRYSDLRTTEGRQLKQMMDELVDDLGGPEAISAKQKLILQNVRSKMIVLLQIGKYIDEQETLIKDGRLLPILRESYSGYTETLRRDIQALTDLVSDKGKGPDLSAYIEQTYSKDKK